MQRRHAPHCGSSLVGLGALLLAAPVLAQAEREATLPEVRVIQRTPLPGFDVDARRYPGNAQQATGDEIDAAGAGTLPEFMNRHLLGVTASDVQGSPFQAEISYRGQRLSPLLGSAQGLSLYFDGVRLNQPFGDVVNWELIPEAAIGGLALVPGSNPLYGLNTLAGALVLTPKTGLTHEGTEADFSVGSAGRARIDFSHGRKWGEGWHAFVAGTLFREDGWREESPGRFGNFYAKVGRRQGRDEWDIGVLHGQSDLIGNGLGTESLLAQDWRSIYTLTDVTKARDTLVTAHASREIDSTTRIGALAWYRQGGRDATSGEVSEDWGQWLASCRDTPDAPRCSDPTDPGFVGPAATLNRSRSRQDEVGASLQWTARRGAHQFALGTELAGGRTEHDQFSAPGTFDAQRHAVDIGVPETHDVALRGRTQRFALFGADAIDLARGTQLTAAARWDRTRIRNRLGHPEPLEEESFTYSKLNPSLGITHDWNPATTLFASLSQGTRVPTALELGCADAAQPCVLPTGLQADPFLKQVVSRTFELGARWRAGSALSISGALFRTDNRDDIVFLRSSVSQAGFFANIDRTRRQGIELAAQGRRGTVDWSAGYTFLDATYQSSGVLPGPLSTADQPNTFAPGTRIAGLPRHVLKVSADWRVLPQLRLGVDWQAVSSRVLSGNESGSRPELGDVAGYGVLNARAHWQFDERWELHVRVDNLLDQRYANAGAGNLDFFPAGRPVLPPGEPAPARFLAPGAPRMVAVGVRYAWDR